MAYQGNVRACETGQKHPGNAVFPNFGNTCFRSPRHAASLPMSRAAIAATPPRSALFVAPVPLFVAPVPLFVAPVPLFVASVPLFVAPLVLFVAPVPLFVAPLALWLAPQKSFQSCRRGFPSRWFRDATYGILSP